MAEFIGILLYHIKTICCKKHFNIPGKSCINKSKSRENEEVKAVATFPDFSNYREPLLFGCSNAPNYYSADK